MLTNVQENEYLGKSLFLAYTLMSLVLDLTQMVLVVRKHLQMTNIIMLDNFNYYNFLREPILLEVLPLFYTLMSLVMDLKSGEGNPGFVEDGRASSVNDPNYQVIDP